MKKIFSFNKNWKFRKESEIFSSLADDDFDMYRSNTKTGIMGGPKSSSFYDEDWETVNLPHDWVIEEEPCECYAVSQGNRPQGAVWYRKHFILSEKYEGKKVFLKFDGIATAAEIYFNSVKVAYLEGGYTPLVIDVTDFVDFSKNNTVAVRADCTSKEGWWYEGGGIYRNTYLIIKESAYFQENGVFVTARNNNDGSWKISFCTEIVNGEDCEVTAELEGEEYAESPIYVKNPLLWDAENPNLYEIIVKLKKNGVLYDEERIKFGFREARFDKDEGFFINGKKTKIKGVCLHDNHAGVGVAVDKSILRYRMMKLKEMGCNGVRTAHNPYCPEFYELCDELGFYVMDEVRHFSSTSSCLWELEQFVKRDRNHPSVILWSLFNEEPLQCSAVGEKIIKTMKEALYKYDKTRPVTGGMNGPLEISGVVNQVDVMGFNYLQYGYDEFHKIYPDIPIVGSETGSCLSTRDEQITDKEKSHVCCYGKKLGENLRHWSNTPGDTWRYIMERPFVAGGFYWAGIDYYGESGPFYWPGITSNFGAMDICCFPKNNYFWLKALWNSEYLIEIPCPWNGKNGETLDVACYSNCETIELFINQKSLGERPNNVYAPEIYKIPYEKGSLKVIGRVCGKIVCEKEIRSYGDKRALDIVVSRKRIQETESAIFDVYLKDEYGQIVKNEDREVSIEVDNGVIIGSGNGDNANHRNGKSNSQRLFHGCAQFIVKPKDGGMLVVRAEEAETCVEVLQSSIDEIDAVPYKAYSYNHRMSDIHETYPTNAQIIDNKFTWIPTMIGVPKSLMLSGKSGYAVISGTIDLPKLTDKKIILKIEGIKGNFDIFYGETKVYSSEGNYSGNVEISLDGNLNEIRSAVGIVFALDKKDVAISGNIYAEFI